MPEQDPEKMRKIFDDITKEANVNENPFTGIHVAYENMRKAGFTWREACTIIGVWIFHAGQ